MRYYLGVDWADQTHAVCVIDEDATRIVAHPVPHTAEGLSEWGRGLDQWRARGIELWAAIERREGRVVDFLLDHGVVVYPVNPKALDRAEPVEVSRGGGGRECHREVHGEPPRSHSITRNSRPLGGPLTADRRMGMVFGSTPAARGAAG